MYKIDKIDNPILTDKGSQFYQIRILNGLINFIVNLIARKLKSN